MKSQIKHLFYGMVVFTALFVSSPVSADNDTSSAAVELKYIGSINNKPVFQLNILNNGTDKEYIVSILDELGNVLYKSGAKYNSSKKFMLNTDELDLEKTIRFEVMGRTTNKKFTYEINRISRTTDETSVVALKL